MKNQNLSVPLSMQTGLYGKLKTSLFTNYTCQYCAYYHEKTNSCDLRLDNIPINSKTNVCLNFDEFK